jgi:hypothetical protein
MSDMWILKLTSFVALDERNFVEENGASWQLRAKLVYTNLMFWLGVALLSA